MFALASEAISNGRKKGQAIFNPRQMSVFNRRSTARKIMNSLKKKTSQNTFANEAQGLNAITEEWFCWCYKKHTYYNQIVYKCLAAIPTCLYSILSYKFMYVTTITPPVIGIRYNAILAITIIVTTFCCITFVPMPPKSVVTIVQIIFPDIHV